MNAGTGCALTEANQMNATMEPPDANMKIVERDPTNRYVRVCIIIRVASFLCPFASNQIGLLMECGILVDYHVVCICNSTS